MPKKVKEALKTRSSGNKITWTETFVRFKKFAKWKTTLNRGTLTCYENLPIKTHLKKRAIFFACNRNPSSPQISLFKSLYRLSSNNSENPNRRHLPLTGTNHCNSRLQFQLRFQLRSQFSSPIFMWVYCYIGRFTSSNIILHKRAVRWILVASQAEMRKGECVPEVVAYESNLIVMMNYWREIL